MPNSGSFQKDKYFEFVWCSTGDLDCDQVNIFTHVLDSGYSSPKGFDFEGVATENPPVTPQNVKARADALMAILNQRLSWYRHQNLLVPIGGDCR
jgi:hypothetical protein